MRGLTIAGAAAALVLSGVSAAPQVADVNVKQTLTTTITKVKTATETDRAITTTTKYLTQTKLGVTTVTVYSTVVVTSPFPTQTITVTAPASSCAPVTSSKSSSSSTSVNTSFTTTRDAIQVNPTALSTKGLADYAALVGKYFGTAVDYPGTGEGSDPVYLAVATNPHEFNQWTPANIMKYEFTEQSQGQFDFTQADSFVALAHQNGINTIRCHNLIWHNELPNWINNPAVPWNRTTLLPVMLNHIDKLITHFGDNCTHWDVVNEAISDSATPTNPWRSTVWYNAIGPDFVQQAFNQAAATVARQGLKVKLFYNDYNIEYNQTKTNIAAQLVANLTAAKVQIDGVGLQSHFIIGSAPSAASFNAVMQEFTSQTNSVGQKVIVAVTELDIRGNVPISDALQVQQFWDYRNVTAGCVLNAGCVGLTLWDFDDTYSWIPGTFPGQGWGTPWYLNSTSGALTKKLAYDGIIDGLDSSYALRK